MGEPENITTVMAADASELPKPEDLVARSIVPVKSAFLRPHSLRSLSSSLNPPSTGDAERNERKDSDVFNKEKKSKRQIKRDRQKVCRAADGYKMVPLFVFYHDVLMYGLIVVLWVLCTCFGFLGSEICKEYMLDGC